MAAITPFIEQQAEEVEEDLVERRASGLNGAQKRPPHVKRGLDEPDEQFAQLNQLVYTRYAMEEALQGATFHVERDGREYFLVLDEPLDINVVPWQAFPQPARRSALLSWTKKMGTWSFSLPAGGTVIGGSCPAANAVQAVIPERERRNSLRVIQQSVGDVDARAAICSSCYATLGNYRLGTQQFRQLLAFSWVKQTLRSGEFVETMSEAVRVANYRLEGGSMVGVRYPSERREPGVRAYFRIHDSGDFFSTDYYDAWMEIAESNSDIMFWAPTRVWVLPQFREHIERNRAANLIVRPSAYHVGDPAPRRQGFTGSGTTSLIITEDNGMTPERESLVEGEARLEAGGDDRYTWRCQAYAVLKEAHSCRHAIDPTGKVGCRTCWVTPEEEVNYALH